MALFLVNEYLRTLTVMLTPYCVPTTGSKPHFHVSCNLCVPFLLQYPLMLCVEAGYVSKPFSLGPSSVYEGSVMMKVEG